MGRLVRQVRSSDRNAPQRNSVHDLEGTSSIGTSDLPKTKNGDKRDVPLSSQARALFGLLHRGQGRIIPLKPGTFETYWIRAVPATGIKIFTFMTFGMRQRRGWLRSFMITMELSRGDWAPGPSGSERLLPSQCRIARR